MSAPEDFTIDPQTVKELQLLEAALSDVDLEIAAKQYLMTRDIFASRRQTIAKIPAFWAVVFEHAQRDLEAAITADDTELLVKGLVDIEVARPGIPASATPSDCGKDKFGEPRSVAFRFHFKDNDWIADKVLEKHFYYRYAKDGTAGLVSEPVKINWKAGKDLTQGLTDAAYNLWVAQKGNAAQKLDAVLDKDARKARDAAAKQLPEYKALAAMLEDADKAEGAISFFNFFSYRGRWISEAESVEAKAELEAKRARAAAGQSTKEDDEDDEDEEDDFAEEDVETFPAGHEVATTISDEIYPSAIDYYMEDDAELSELDIEDDDSDEEDVEMS
ncbi:hypothetical protein MCOR25_009808 [Pyricularia grisea]|uniref:Uncharacterized protein n=1 Tax=Pyricularia grisea TaxID=148305 RepID=A0A6P8AZ23_PYRGI|nr:hypothetical protein PgNI_10092 [Pyricularia grisea]KAI6351688.1 hypothetical protein MCOR25_009808 [Pyricularia grisea]TLD07544.1 hypothetical protein PgNI_10092 [Pyricularia grisea]